MLKEKYGSGRARCFLQVLESQHSSLVFVGAPTQGCCSPLSHARTKCSPRDSSLPLRHGELIIIVYTFELGHPEALLVITELLTVTKLIRWCWSLIKNNKQEFSLDLSETNDNGKWTQATLNALMRLLTTLLSTLSSSLSKVSSSHSMSFFTW